MGSGSGPRVGGQDQDAAAAHGAEHQIAGSFGGYSSKASAVAGEEGPMMLASATNGKAEAEPLTIERGHLEKAIAVDGDKAPAAREASDKAPAAREGLTPLPKEEVDLVLSWKRGKLSGMYSTPEAIEDFEALSDSCAKYQAWMRAEYEANDGVVWVDDEFLREQAEGLQALMDEIDEDDDFDFTGWHFVGDIDSPGWNIPRPSVQLDEDGQEGAVVKMR